MEKKTIKSDSDPGTMPEEKIKWYEFYGRIVLHWFYFAGFVGSAIPAYVIFSILVIPLKWINVEWYYSALGMIDKMFHSIGVSSSMVVGHKLFYCGDDVTPCVTNGARTAFISNHSQPDDILLKFDFLHSFPNTSEHTMWASFEPVKYTSLGLCVAIRGDFFLSQGREKRDDNLEYVREKLRKNFIPRRRFLVMYPEGGFPYHLREVNDRYTEKYNLPKTKHTVLPRVGAMKAFMDVLVPKDGEKRYLDYVVDITLAHRKVYHYFWLGFGIRFPNLTGFLLRVYPIEEIPKDEEGLKKWMYNVWVEKDKFIDEFKRTGKYPEYGKIKPTFVKQNMSRVFLANFLNFISMLIGFSALYWIYLQLNFSFLFE